MSASVLIEQGFECLGPCFLKIVDFAHLLFLAWIVGDQRGKCRDILPERGAGVAKIRQVLVIGRQQISEE